MRLACMTLALKEERLMPKFIQLMQDRVEEILVLNSSKPWHGEINETDNTANIASSLGATVVVHNWPSEAEQRNAGQEYLSDYDWVIVLDPDEFIDNANWDALYHFLEMTPTRAVVVEHQRVFWKDKEVYPHTDYQQIVAVRPSVRFVENRVVDNGYGVAPVELLHFSWARPDEEIWRKINTYGHAGEFDALKWFSEVWQSQKTTNLHPLTPETLKGLIDVNLPPEIKELGLL